MLRSDDGVVCSPFVNSARQCQCCGRCLFVILLIVVMMMMVVVKKWEQRCGGLCSFVCLIECLLAIIKKLMGVKENLICPTSSYPRKFLIEKSYYFLYNCIINFTLDAFNKMKINCVAACFFI